VFFTPEAPKSYTAAVYAYNLANDRVVDVSAASPLVYYSGSPARPLPVIEKMTLTDISVAWTPVEGESYSLVFYDSPNPKAFVNGDPDKVISYTTEPVDIFGTPGVKSYYNISSNPTNGFAKFLEDGKYFAVKITASNYFAKSTESLYSDPEQAPPSVPSKIGSGKLLAGTKTPELDISWGYSDRADTVTINFYNVFSDFNGNAEYVGGLIDISLTTVSNASRQLVPFPSSVYTRGHYFTARVTPSNYGGITHSGYSVPPIYFPNYPERPTNVTLTNFLPGSRTVSWTPPSTGDSPTQGYAIQFFSYTATTSEQQVTTIGNQIGVSEIVLSTAQALACNYSYTVGFTAQGATYYYAKVFTSNLAGRNQIDASSSAFYYPNLPTPQTPTITNVTNTSAIVSWTPVLGETYYLTISRADIVRNLIYGTKDSAGNSTGIIQSILDNQYVGTTSPFTYSANFPYDYKIYTAQLKSSNIAGEGSFSQYASGKEVLPVAPSAPTIDYITASKIDVTWPAASNAESYAVQVFDASTNVINTTYYTAGSCNAAIDEISNRAYGVAVSRTTATLFPWSPINGKNYYAKVISLNLGNLYLSDTEWGPYTSTKSTNIYFPNLPPKPVVSNFLITSSNNASVTWTDGCGSILDKANYFNVTIGKAAVVEQQNAISFTGDTQHSLLTITGSGSSANSGYFYGTTDYTQHIGSYNGSSYPLVLNGPDFSNVATTITYQQQGNQSNGTFLVSPPGHYFTANKSTITGTGYFSIFQDSMYITPVTTSTLTVTSPLGNVTTGTIIYCQDFPGGQATVTYFIPTPLSIRINVALTLDTFTHDAYISNVSSSATSDLFTFFPATSQMTVTTMEYDTIASNYGIVYPRAYTGLLRATNVLESHVTSGTYSFGTTLIESPTTDPIYVYNNVWWAGNITDNGNGTGLASQVDITLPYYPQINTYVLVKEDSLYPPSKMSVYAQITTASSTTGGINFTYLAPGGTIEKFFETFPCPVIANYAAIKMTGILQAGVMQFTNITNFTATITSQSEDFFDILQVDDIICVPDYNPNSESIDYTFSTFIVTDKRNYGQVYDISGLVMGKTDSPNSAALLDQMNLKFNTANIGVLLPSTENYKVISAGNASFTYTTSRVVITGTFGTDFSVKFAAGSTLKDERVIGQNEFNEDITGIYTINIISQISGTTGEAGTYQTDYNSSYIESGSLLITGNAVIPAASLSSVANNSELVILPPNSPTTIGYIPLGTSTNTTNGIDTLIGIIQYGKIWNANLWDTGTLTAMVDVSFAVTTQISTAGGSGYGRYGTYALDRAYSNYYFPINPVDGSPLPGFVATTSTEIYIMPGYASCTAPNGTMTVTGDVSGSFVAGMTLYGTEVASGTRILTLGDGTTGKVGTYTITPAQNLTSNLSNVYGFQSTGTQVPNSSIQIVGGKTGYGFTSAGFQSGNYYGTLVQAYNLAGDSFRIYPVSPTYFPYRPSPATGVAITSMTASSFTVNFGAVLGNTYTMNLYGISTVNADYYTSSTGVYATNPYYIESITPADQNAVINLRNISGSATIKVQGPMIQLLSNVSVQPASTISYLVANSTYQNFAINIVASNIAGPTTSDYSAAYQPHPTPPTDVVFDSIRPEGIGISWTEGLFAKSYYVFATDLSTNVTFFASNTLSNTTYVQLNSNILSPLGNLVSHTYKATVISVNSTVPGIPFGRWYWQGANPDYWKITTPKVTDVTALSYSSDSSTNSFPSQLRTVSNVTLSITASNVSVSWSRGNYLKTGTFNYPQTYAVRFRQLGASRNTNPASYSWDSQFTNDTTVLGALFEGYTSTSYTQNNFFVFRNLWYSVTISNYDGFSSNVNYDCSDISDNNTTIYSVFDTTPPTSTLRSIRFHQIPDYLNWSPANYATPWVSSYVKNIRWDTTYSNLIFDLDASYTPPNSWSGRTYYYQIQTVNDSGTGLSSSSWPRTTTNPTLISAGTAVSIPVPTFKNDPYVRWSFQIIPSNIIGYGLGTTSFIPMPPSPVSNVTIDRWDNNTDGTRTFYLSWNGGVNALFSGNYNGYDISSIFYYDTQSSMATKQFSNFSNRAQAISPTEYKSPNWTSLAHTTSATLTTTGSTSNNIMANKWVAATVAVFNWSTVKNAQYAATVSPLGTSTFVNAPPSTPVPTLVSITSNTFLIKWYLSNPSNSSFNPSVESQNSYRIAILCNDSASAISGIYWSNVPTNFSNLWAYSDIGVPSSSLDLCNTGYTMIVSGTNIRHNYNSNQPSYYSAIVQSYNTAGSSYTTSVGSTPALYWSL
jgi:hypothetical protein